MSGLEIFLLAAGAIFFILGFFLPAGKEEVSGQTKEMVKEEIQNLVSQEMNGVKSHVSDVVDEAVEYAMEKTERSLERLSNEKIMAVNEYSDTVLKEIHKNHEEVMFLYDMLNDKHTSLKNTVSEVNQTVKTVEESTREAESAVNLLRQLKQEDTQDGGLDVSGRTQMPQGRTQPSPDRIQLPSEEAQASSETVQTPFEEEAYGMNVEQSGPELNFDNEDAEDGIGIPRNEQILTLHKQGKSTVAIAKELGLGVGEVKLVIDLYKNL